MINDWPLEYRLVYFSGSVAGHQGATQEDADHVAHFFDAGEEEIRFFELWANLLAKGNGRSMTV